MTALLRLRDPLGERTFDGQTALTIGGPGAAIPLPGLAAGVVLARITVSEALLTLEALARGLRCNGRAIDGSIALATGDVIQAGDARLFVQFTRDERVLRVDHLTGNATSPPAFDPHDALMESEDAPPPRAIPRVEFRVPVAGLTSVAALATPRRWHWVAIAAGIALAGFWYVMSVVALPFRVDPSDARVGFADTIGDFRAGDRLYALAGDHELLAERDGYAPLRRVVSVGNDAAVPLILVLEKLPGLLKVTTGGVHGSVVIVELVTPEAPSHRAAYNFVTMPINGVEFLPLVMQRAIPYWLGQGIEVPELLTMSSLRVLQRVMGHPGAYQP